MKFVDFAAKHQRGDPSPERAKTDEEYFAAKIMRKASK
jgi:hypothetical protein